MMDSEIGLTTGTSAFAIGQIFKGEYPPEAAVWCNENGARIEERDGTYVIVGIPEESLEEAKARKLREIKAAVDTALLPLSQEYPYKEQFSFQRQELEARALVEDPSAPAPLLTAIATARVIGTTELALKVIAKADATTAVTGTVIGEAQKDKDRLEAAQSVEDVNAIVPAYKLPEVK